MLISKRIFKQLSFAYEKANNPKQSLVFLKKYSRLSDSITTHFYSNASENMVDKTQFDEQLKKFTNFPVASVLLLKLIVVQHEK